MATLNTLRTRGGIIVSIVIGLALLAFLLGDLTSSGSMGGGAQNASVGEIDGNKVGYIEYANKVDELGRISQAMSGQSALSEEENENIRGMAWEAMLMKYSYRPGFEIMGLGVGQAEQQDMTMGRYISPVISSIFMDRTTGAYSSDMLRSFIANLDLDTSGQTQMIWQHLKQQMSEQRMISKYVTLLQQATYVTDLEADKAVKDANEVYDINYVKLDYSTIPDSLVVVSDAQIKEYYNKKKETFKQTKSRRMEYVIFPLDPSEDDLAEAKKFITTIASEFSEAPNAMQYAQLNSHEQPSQSFVKRAELGEDIAKVVFDKDEMYGPELKNDQYTLVRRVEKKMLPDSLGARHILIDKENTKLKDSILTALKGGAAFEMLASKHSIDTGTAMTGGSLGIFSPEQMIPEFSEACLSAKVGSVFSVDTQYGTHIVKLTLKSPLIEKVQVATITYDIDPSSYTQQSVYSKVSSFVNQASEGSSEFKQAVKDNSLASRTAYASPTDLNVRGLDNSREMLRWAYNAKLGDVSQIMEINGDYVVAMLAEITEDDYRSLASATPIIKRELIKQGKAKMLYDKMDGNNIEEVSTTVDQPIGEVLGLKYTDYTAGDAGYDFKFIGATAGGVDVGELSGAVAGQRGVYVFEVGSLMEEANTDFESEKVRLETMNRTYLGQRVNQSLVELSEVSDERVKFF